MRLYLPAPRRGPAVPRRTVLAGAAAAAVGVAAPAGCARTEPSRTTSGGPATKLTYATSFGFFGRDSYVFVAKDKGWFAEAGLDVTIVPGQGTQDLVTKLTTGTVQFCSMDLTGLLLVAHRPGVQAVTAVAGIHQHSLAGIITLEGRGITGPRDLEGRSVGDPIGSVNSLLFPAYARLAGVNERRVRFVNLPAPQLPADLASGSVDAIGQFMVGKPLIENASGGRHAVLLPYSDYMADLFGNVLATTRTLTKDDPGLVRRFRDVLLRALAYALEHPAEAGAILNKQQPVANAVVAGKELELMAAYVRPARPDQPIGVIDPLRVEHAIRLLQGANVIPAGLAGEQVVSFDFAPQPDVGDAPRRGLQREGVGT